MDRPSGSNLCQFTASGTSDVHLLLEESSWTGGVAKLPVGTHLRKRYTKAFHCIGNDLVDRFKRSLSRTNFLIVSKDHNSQIPRIIVLYMGALKLKRTRLPDASHGVDGKMISNICPTSAKVPFSNEIKPTQRINVRTGRNRHNRVMVHCDPGNVCHRIGEPTLG